MNRFSDTLNVSIDITVAGIIGVNEKAQSLKTFIWQVLEWHIEGLSWDEKECGTKTVSLGKALGPQFPHRSILYVVNLLIPSCFLITLDLFSFLLPPQSVGRSSFKMTLTLGYTVFLLIMNDLLPVTGETTPLMNVLFSVSLTLMVASLLETVFITNIHFSSSQYSAVPQWLSVLVLQYLAVVVFLPPKKNNRITFFLQPPATDPAINTSIVSSRDLQSICGDTPPEKPLLEPALDELRKLSRDLMAICLQMDNHIQGTKSSQEWQMIGIVVDRRLFGLYIIFISVSSITIVSIWIWNNSYVG